MPPTPPPIRLQTPRLLLRPPAPEDFEPWAAFAADPEVMTFLGGVQPRAMAWRSLATVAGSWALYGFGMFSVVERSTGAWVGRIGPWRPEGWPGPEVGWGLARAAWGKGYALEAAEASIKFAFEQLGWSEVIHCIGEKNASSLALAKRLGSRLRGLGRLPPPYETTEVQIWAQTRDEWASRAAHTREPG